MRAKASAMQGELRLAKRKAGSLENDLDNNSRQLAGAMAENTKLKTAQPQTVTVSLPSGGMRSTIARNLAKRFKDMGIDVITDERTGSIILLLDEAFLFRHDSYELRKKIQSKLKLIIPAYTEELFKDPYIRDNITAVNIIGHASPYYFGAVDPVTASYKAYAYNLTLSSNRSLQITKFILGNKIGKYNYKAILRRKAKTSGKSFMHPLLMDQSEARRDKTCGIYSCRRSRRVEISFTLANEFANAGKAMNKVAKTVNEDVNLATKFLNMFNSF